jgi:exonuclease III
LKQDGEGHFILIKSRIYHDDFSVLNINSPNTRAHTFFKETLLNVKLHIESNIIIVWDFNNLISPIDKSSRQKLKRKIMELTDVTTQMGLRDIYRNFHSNTKKYTFFSAPHGTFSKTGHIFSHKASLNRYKKSEITLCISSDHHGLKLDFNNI